MICVDRTNVLRRGTAADNVVHRRCRAFAVAEPGDTRPGCSDKTETAPSRSGS